MPLTLRVTSYRNQPPSAPLVRRFERRGGIIGRDPKADLHLPCPEKLVSREQALVDYRAGLYILKDRGQNPTLINGRPAQRDQEVVLNERDQLLIGDYLIEVNVEADLAASAPATDMPLPDDIDDSILGIRGAAILRVPLAGDPTPPELPIDHVSPENERWVDPIMHLEVPSPTPSPLIPDDDSMFRPRPKVAQRPPVHEPVVETPEVFPDPLPEPPRESPRARAAPSPPRPPVGSSADAEEVWTALLEGLAIPDFVPTGTQADAARLVGEMLRIALGGLMEVLVARSVTKQEMRADVTLIGPRDNNALKFLPNVDSALKQLLGGSQRGYLPAAESVERAIHDIRTHEVAVMAGMRAALQGVLERLSPDKVERAIADRAGFLDSLPGQRKAKLWDAAVETYKQVMQESRDDFQRLFGDTFARAYEEQVERMQSK